MEPKVVIVIVNYNGEKFQNDCLRTIYEMDYSNYEVVIVDNASTDNSMKMAEAEYPQIKTIYLESNLGVTKGNNVGISYSLEVNADYTLLLNNDVELHKDTLKLLVCNADRNTITVPKIFYYDNLKLLWYAGGSLDWKKGGAFHKGIGTIDSEGEQENEFVTYSPTCCMLIPNQTFKDIGMMDETYFMYYDDTDFCARVFDSSYRIKYVPNSFLWHKVSSSSGGEDSPFKVYYLNRNKLYYMKKHKKYVRVSAVLYTFFKCFVLWALSPIYKKKNKLIFKAFKDYFSGKMFMQKI